MRKARFDFRSGRVRTEDEWPWPSVPGRVWITDQRTAELMREAFEAGRREESRLRRMRNSPAR